MCQKVFSVHLHVKIIIVCDNKCPKKDAFSRNPNNNMLRITKQKGVNLEVEMSATYSILTQCPRLAVYLVMTTCYSDEWHSDCQPCSLYTPHKGAPCSGCLATSRNSTFLEEVSCV